jgi:predicted lipoprotein with Yx(FWY)xxD motif
MPRRQPHRELVHAVSIRRVVVAGAIAVAMPWVIVSSAATGVVKDRAAKGVVISAVTNARWGTILVSGRTLYTLSPSAVPCRAACHRYWPEVLLPTGVAHATAGHGVRAAKLGTRGRARGARQVTYAGKALYFFSLDTGPGQVHGNLKDTWGTWSVVVVKPLAAPATTTSAPARATTTLAPVTTTSTPLTTTTPGGGGGIGF